MPVADALGRVLARDVPAPLSLPPFTNSAMDGYAVRAADAVAGEVLPVAFDVPAGRTDVPALPVGAACRIMTGAPVPDGADAIVPVERTDGGIERVRIDEAPEPGRFFRAAGSDIEAGDVALRGGETVGPAVVGFAAALGLTTVPVLAPPHVAVLSTGSELVEPGTPLRPGQIYESNAPMLASAIREAGATAEVVRFVADDADAFLARLAERISAGGVDLVVTSGGVSAGAFEVVKDALASRGVDFVKVAMQPGMPQGCGTVDLGGVQVPFVTFPGNPVSALVSFEVFLRPALCAAMGLPVVGMVGGGQLSRMTHQAAIALGLSLRELADGGFTRVSFGMQSAVPHVLGFKPEESIVLVPFRPGLPITRVDLPKTAADREEVWGAISGPYGRHARPGSRLAILCFTDDRRSAELASQQEVVIVPIEGDVATKVLENEFFAANTIPAGTYDNQAADVQTIAVGAQWLTSADQPEELIYNITKALWNDNTRKQLDAGHAKGKMIVKENAAAGLGLPGQALSALPYLATILALVLLSLGRRRGGSLAPAALGRVFTPHR